MGNLNGLKKILRSWCKMLHDSMHYYSKRCVEMRDFFGKYSVEPMPDNVELDKCYLEDYGEYLAFRKYREYGDNIVESKRWTYSHKTSYSKLIVFRNDEREMEDDFNYYGFSDSEVPDVKEELLQTEVGRMELFEYLAWLQQRKL